MNLETFWFLVIGISFTMFFLLDGFDIGVAILLPFFPKTSNTRYQSLTSIWPFWDGNFLWGLAGAVALLTLFPRVFNGILSGMYPVVILLIVALILRPLAFELSYVKKGGSKSWNTVLTLSSFFMALIIGIIFGNTLWGYNTLPDGRSSKGLFSLFNPFSFLTGILFVVMFLTHGIAWLFYKLEDTAPAIQIFKKIRFILPVVLTIWIIWVQGFTGAGNKVLFWVFSFLCVLSYLTLALIGPNQRKLGRALLISISGIVFWWITESVIQFPVLIRSGNTGIVDLTIYNSGFINATGRMLHWIAPITLLIVIIYTSMVYSVFKGKISKKHF
jgi:cytochrome d ubiquinol oxidase subunit II